MKILATLLIIGLFVHRSYGNCILAGVGDNTEQITGTTATDTQTEAFRTFDTTNVLSVSIASTDTSGYPYIDVSYDADAQTLTFSPKPAFANFEQEWPSETTAPTLTLSVQLQCQNGIPRFVSLHVRIDDTNNNEPVFSNPTYEYKIPMPFPASLDVTQYGESIIVTDIDITNTRVEFSIEPADFNIRYDGPMVDSNNKKHRALLTPKQPIRFDEPHTYVMTVRDVGNPQLSTTATITIDIDEAASVAQSPVFAEAFTIDEYRSDEVDEFYTEVRLSTGFNARVSLSGTYNEYFEATNTADGTVSVALSQPLPLDAITTPFIVLTLTATLDNAETNGKMAIIITLPVDDDTTTPTDCPTEPTSAPTDCPIDCTECPTDPPSTECPPDPTDCPTTDCPLDCTECPTDPTATDCPIDCTECPTDPTATDCPIDCTECPTDAPTTECPIDCTECPTDPPPTECPTTDCPLDCTECPTDPTATDCPIDCTECPTDPTATDCPNTTECPLDCTECPTDPTSTDCPDGSTPEDCNCPTTVDPPSAIVEFVAQLYTIDMYPSGTIDMMVEATSTITEEITYSTLETMPNNLVLTPNGHLQTVGRLPTGSYGYTLVATGSISGAQDTSLLRIAVGSMDGTGELVAADSLVVRNVREEQENPQVLIPHLNYDVDYYFEIEGVVPNTDKICIDADGNVVALKLDRESSEFDGLNAQYTATVRLKEGISTSTCTSRFSPLQQMLRGTRAVSEDQCLILEDISNEEDKIVVAVIVADANDHAPQFEPNNILIGYPEESILSLVSPPYIIQAQATDDDIGINAELSYETVGSNRVVIRSDSGYVYPTDDLYDSDDLIFQVRATDQNGAGLTSNTLSVTVKFLKQQHISVIAYKNQYLEDVDDILSRLSTQAGANINIKYLTASVLPTNDLSRSARDGNDNYLVIIAYAFRQSTLLTTGELQQLLPDADDLDISALPNTSVRGTDDDDSNAGLIAAVIVLAILLAIGLIGFIALYLLKFRKTENYSKMEEDGLSKSQNPDNTTPPQFVKNKNLAASKVDVDIQMRRPTGIVFSSQFIDDDVSPTTPAAPEEAMNDQLRDRRKSVAFNAEIEEISIERDAENEGEQDSEKKESSSKEESGENTETSKL